MMSRSVRLAWNQFLFNVANQFGLNGELLEERLRAVIVDDNTANFIMSNFSTNKFALAARSVVQPSIGGFVPALYSRWSYKDLFTGEAITNVIFIDGVNELFKSDLVKVVYIQKPKSIFYINTGGSGNGNTGGSGNGNTGGSGNGNTGGNLPPEKTIAGFDTKNILLIAAVAAGIYFITK